MHHMMKWFSSSDKQRTDRHAVLLISVQEFNTTLQRLVVVIPAGLHNCSHLLLVLSAVFPVQLCCFVVCWTVWVWIMQKRLQWYKHHWTLHSRFKLQVQAISFLIMNEQCHHYVHPNRCFRNHSSLSLLVFKLWHYSGMLLCNMICTRCLILPETKVRAEHFCYGTDSTVLTQLFSKKIHKNLMYLCKTKFNVKWPLKVMYFGVSGKATRD